MAAHFGYQLIDLCHPLTSKAPTWNGSCGFELQVKMEHSAGCLVHQVRSHAGVGTHLDSPLHFYPEAPSVGELPLESFFGPAAVLHLGSQSGENFSVTDGEILVWEQQHGKIEKGSFALFELGWAERWSTPERYRNLGPDGAMRFPSIDESAARLLLERGVAGVGVDTLSPDRPGSGFPVHFLLLGAGGVILENLANLAKLPPTGSWLLAFPPPWIGASEAPVRALAAIPQS